MVMEQKTIARIQKTMQKLIKKRKLSSEEIHRIFKPLIERKLNPGVWIHVHGNHGFKESISIIKINKDHQIYAFFALAKSGMDLKEQKNQ